nr:hypothetical protein [uncultured Flavobacterium sp.]
MIANFYIIPQSFDHDAISNEKFFSSLENFIADYHNLIMYKDENNIYIQEDVFEVQLANGHNLSQFIYSNDIVLNGKERSLKQFLSNVFSKLPTVKIDIDELKTQLKNNSIESCTGIISLFKIDNIADENQIVYNTNSWYSFRRYHLGSFFGDQDYFINECIKYFPKLFFHEKTYTSVGKILNNFACKIVRHLEALNDVLPTVINKGYSNHTDLLTQFSNSAQLDEKATLEGSNKSRLKFKFINKATGKIEELVCEPHLKLSKNDKDDATYFKNRIYFHFGKINIEESKILVAHIGEHL